MAKSESDNAKSTSKAQVSAEMQSIISSLQKGSMLTKVRSRGRQYQRYFYVDTTSLTIACSGSRRCMKRSARSCIPIGHIAEIHEDDDLSPTHRQKNVPSFMVVVGEQMKHLNFIAPSTNIKDMWVRGLRFLSGKRSVEDPVKQEQMWLEDCFFKTDKNRDGVLDKDEIVGLLKSLNVSSAVAYDMRERARGQKLDIDDFITLYREFSKRKELEDIFDIYSADQVSMNISELSEFFIIEEHQKVSENKLEDIIARSEQCPKLKAEKSLSRVGFRMMFFLPEMNVKTEEARMSNSLPGHESTHLSLFHKLIAQYISRGAPTLWH